MHLYNMALFTCMTIMLYSVYTTPALYTRTFVLIRIAELKLHKKASNNGFKAALKFFVRKPFLVSFLIVYMGI